jgi:hypothetical protein
MFRASFKASRTPPPPYCGAPGVVQVTRLPAASKTPPPPSLACFRLMFLNLALCLVHASKPLLLEALLSLLDYCKTVLVPNLVPVVHSSFALSTSLKAPSLVLFFSGASTLGCGIPGRAPPNP